MLIREGERKEKRFSTLGNYSQF